MPSRVSSTIRHSRRADRLYSQCLLAMRPCRFCVSRGLLCVVSDLSEHCEQCFRSKRSCELAPPDAEMERLLRQKKEFFDKAMEAKAKATRFAKQHRLVVQKLRELDRREEQNILELEIDEIMADGAVEGDGQLSVPGALSSPSFPDPTVGEGSTDPFLGLLDSPGRSAEVPQGSS
jgi:hypothetical protein